MTGGDALRRGYGLPPDAMHACCVGVCDRCNAWQLGIRPDYPTYWCQCLPATHPTLTQSLTMLCAHHAHASYRPDLMVSTDSFRVFPFGIVATWASTPAALPSPAPPITLQTSPGILCRDAENIPSACTLTGGVERVERLGS